MQPSELRVRRERAGLTQAGLAARLEVAPNTVARWERGELTIARPAMVGAMLDRLAEEATRRAADAYGNTEPPRPGVDDEDEEG